MSDQTAISWCEHTFNLWWGCDEPPAGPDSTEVSPECLNCYAKAWDHRLGGNHWGATAPRKFASDAYWAKPLKWNAAAERAGKRAAVFCQSMGDWAELHADPAVNARMDVERTRLWALIQRTPWLDWLMLTKRAERLRGLLPWHTAFAPGRMPREDAQRALEVPWPNVWPGVTCGARSSLWRIAELRKVRAAVRFVSCEPLLEHISAGDWDDAIGPDLRHPATALADLRNPIHWLIVGDESAKERARRPAQLDWVRTAREAALRHGVAFHFKQWNGPSSNDVHGMRSEGYSSGKLGKIHLPVLDGRVWDQRPSR